MARLERRLRRLEARLTDRSRLVPRTQKWLDYWTARLDELVNGAELDVKLPVDFLDVLIARAAGTSGGDQTGPGHSDCRIDYR
jgi:hypothetical protein